jgi:hypothetical protein
MKQQTLPQAIACVYRGCNNVYILDEHFGCSNVYYYISRLPVRCDGLQQYPYKLSTKKIQTYKKKIDQNME